MRTKDDWFAHIQQIHQQRIAMGLDRVGTVADRLQLRHFSCPVITVAGTNGKGSCAKTLESIYSAAGYRAGLYTSPHLLEFNERICINQKMVEDGDLLRAFEIIESARQEVVLSFFEFTTLAGLLLFQEAQCDVLILEVGLGGRLDAVNIVESDIAILTSVAMDHMDFLGNDRAAIGYEKACIARRNKPFISAETDLPMTVEKTVADIGAHLYQINRDFFYDDKKYPIPHLKKENIAAAICAVALLQTRLPVSELKIAEGISHTKWPARFEMISKPFPMVFDVAHNPHSAAWLAEQYAKLPRAKTYAVVGMLKDKPMLESVSFLMPWVDVWFVCDLSKSVERGADGAAIFQFLESQQRTCYYFEKIADAMVAIKTAHCQRESDRALIFGSFHTVADAKRWISRN